MQEWFRKAKTNLKMGKMYLVKVEIEKLIKMKELF